MPSFTEATFPLDKGDWHSYLQPDYLTAPKVRLCPVAREDSTKRPAVPRWGWGFFGDDYKGTADMPTA
ncbi:MAG: hypothetical protein L0Z50_23730 [Verrucomicrobiales bacterium]|nr:hypothetical protein [Verrucomicrobiales bacterium]